MKAYELLTNAYETNWDDLVYLECGANECGEETSDFKSKNKWYVEGNPKAFEKLKKHHANAINVLLSDKMGDLEFNVTSWSGNSSVKYDPRHLQELRGYGATFEKITVPSITYRHLIENIIKKPVDVFVLDIEGHEVVVLKTFADLKQEQLPKIMCIECGYDWDERLRLLKELGYNPDFYYYNNCVLTHKSFDVKKNVEVIKGYNNSYRKFEYFGTLIYKNNL